MSELEAEKVEVEIHLLNYQKYDERKRRSRMKDAHKEMRAEVQMSHTSLGGLDHLRNH